MEEKAEKLQVELVRSLQEKGIKNKKVLDAFFKISRYYFIKDYIKNESELYQAYFNPFPIGYEQTISQPLICATMLEALDIKEDDIVFEIGTGSGYLTAIISLLAKEVYTSEINNVLLSRAKSRLENLGLQNIHYFAGNGLLGIKNMLFDKIIVSAALPDTPTTLLKFLKNKGTLVAPIDAHECPPDQKLTKITISDGNINTEFICYCKFVPIKSNIIGEN
ncbi:MAG: protein-L-isoaspartate O-methyltransferase family protein [Planctomycetota bacterium]